MVEIKNVINLRKSWFFEKEAAYTCAAVRKCLMSQMFIMQVNTFSLGLSGLGNRKLCNDFLTPFTQKRGLIPDSLITHL